jgi:hypothetical protein
MVGATEEWWSSLNCVMNYMCLCRTMPICELILCNLMMNYSCNNDELFVLCTI